MNIRIIAYKGTNKFGLLVRLFTLGKYDHVAFLMPEGTQADSRRSGFNIYPTHETWNCEADIFDIRMTEEQNGALDCVIRKNAGQWKYDWPGVVGYGFAKLFDLKRYYHSKNRLFCSEAIITFLRQVGVDIYNGYKPHEISPHKLMKNIRIFRYAFTTKIKDKGQIVL